MRRVAAESMRLAGVEARELLSFDTLQLRDLPLTLVVVGPNGGGRLGAAPGDVPGIRVDITLTEPREFELWASFRADLIRNHDELDNYRTQLAQEGDEIVRLMARRDRKVVPGWQFQWVMGGWSGAPRPGPCPSTHAAWRREPAR